MYPYYNYQPNYQQNFQQYPYNVPKQTSNLNGRIVTNVEEARASQIDLDGSLWCFPCPTDGKIYTKSINMQGLPIFNTYELKQPVTNNKQENNVKDNKQNDELRKLLLTLQNKLDVIEKIVKEKSYEYPTDDEPITI